MIISASRRTDIPAFYVPWFLNRIRAGYFISVNPYNYKQRKPVPLTPQGVTAIVFWTKNPGPLLPSLTYLDDLGYNYYFQFTLNHYPRLIEPGVPPLAERIATFRKLGDHVGPHRLVWRYDPLLFSKEYSPEYHLAVFRALSKALAGATLRCTFSFLNHYRQSDRRLAKVVPTLMSPPAEERLALGQRMVEIGKEYGIEVGTCCEDGSDLPRHACIDGDLISRIVGREVNIKKDPYQRSNCLCVSSVDMGSYHTCRAGCIYCYAVGSSRQVENNLTRHDPQSPQLIGQPEGEQLRLF
ncbi:MAG: DUF1848 domain-containing protein [Limnochordia bacterium]|jgi:hypothetical protein